MIAFKKEHDNVFPPSFNFFLHWVFPFLCYNRTNRTLCGAPVLDLLDSCLCGMSLLLGFGGPTYLKALIATLYHHLCGPPMNGLGQTHNVAILLGQMTTLEHPFLLLFFVYLFTFFF